MSHVQFASQPSTRKHCKGNHFITWGSPWLTILNPSSTGKHLFWVRRVAAARRSHPRGGSCHPAHLFTACTEADLPAAGFQKGTDLLVLPQTRKEANPLRSHPIQGNLCSNNRPLSQQKPQKQHICLLQICHGGRNLASWQGQSWRSSVYGIASLTPLQPRSRSTSLAN